MIGFRDRQPLTGTNRLGLGKEVPNAAGNHILGGSEGRDVFLQKLTVLPEFRSAFYLPGSF